MPTLVASSKPNVFGCEGTAITEVSSFTEESSSGSSRGSPGPNLCCWASSGVARLGKLIATGKTLISVLRNRASGEISASAFLQISAVNCG